MADRVRELLQLLDDGRRVRSGLERASGRATELLEAEGRAGRAPHPWRGKPRLAREFRALSDEARRLSVLATSVSLRAEWGGGAAWIDVADACGRLAALWAGFARDLDGRGWGQRAAAAFLRGAWRAFSRLALPPRSLDMRYPPRRARVARSRWYLVQVALWCVPLWRHHREQGKEPGEAGPSRRCDS